MKQTKIKLSDLKAGDLIKIERSDFSDFGFYDEKLSRTIYHLNEHFVLIFLFLNINYYFIFCKKQKGIVIIFNDDTIYKISP